MFCSQILLLVVIVPLISGWTTNLENGDCKNLPDTPNFTKNVDVGFMWFQSRLEQVVYNTRGKIKCVQVQDQWKDGTGGHVEIAEGGYLQTYVKIKMKSKFNRGMHFIVKIYEY